MDKYSAQRSRSSRELDLRPGERVIAIQPVELPVRDGVPSVLRALQSMTARRGEPVAAAALPIGLHDVNVSPELRLFEALFGRDALIVADMLDSWYPEI